MTNKQKNWQKQFDRITDIGISEMRKQIIKGFIKNLLEDIEIHHQKEMGEELRIRTDGILDEIELKKKKRADLEFFIHPKELTENQMVNIQSIADNRYCRGYNKAIENLNKLKEKIKKVW